MAEPIRSIALISSSAQSLTNFRGPLIAALAGAGVKIWALAPDFDAGERAKMAALGAEPIDISLDRAGMRPLRDLADLRGLTSTLRRLRPDATFAYFIKPVIYGSLAARRAGVPHRFALMAGMGYAFTPGEGGGGVKRALLRRVAAGLLRRGLGACEAVFFNNGDDLAQLAGAGLIDPAKGVVLGGTGVDLTHFAAAPLVTQPLRFLMIARLLREKGVAEYAEAARIVKAAHPEVEFHLAGDVDVNPGALTREEVAGWQAEGLLHWHGHVADVRPLIAASSVYVLPSWREGKPRSTQEAMAMGRPVVTTDAVGCRDTVEEGVNGYKVPVRDPASLAAAMLRFVETPGLVAEMGAASRRMAEEMFDVDRINARILAEMGL
jgi:glycosyltransferase involved in cell wall biosynthesis